jgi:hypothetical protein
MPKYIGSNGGTVIAFLVAFPLQSSTRAKHAPRACLEETQAVRRGYAP